MWNCHMTRLAHCGGVPLYSLFRRPVGVLVGVGFEMVERFSLSSEMIGRG